MNPDENHQWISSPDQEPTDSKWQMDHGFNTDKHATFNGMDNWTDAHDHDGERDEHRQKWRENLFQNVGHVTPEE